MLVIGGNSVRPGNDHRIQQRTAATSQPAVWGESQTGMSSEREETGDTSYENTLNDSEGKKQVTHG